MTREPPIAARRHRHLIAPARWVSLHPPLTRHDTFANQDVYESLSAEGCEYRLTGKCLMRDGIRFLPTAPSNTGR